MKLFFSIEQCELSVNCLRDEGKVNVTPGLSSMPQTSIKGYRKQYVTSRSGFTSSESENFMVILLWLWMVFFCFSSVCRWKARIMFDVEGEMQGRINIYKAKCISEESFQTVLSWYKDYVQEDVWVGRAYMKMWLHWKVYIYQVDFGAVIRNLCGMFFLVEVGGRGGFENALSHATYDSSVCFLSSRNKQIKWLKDNPW